MSRHGNRLRYRWGAQTRSTSQVHSSTSISPEAVLEASVSLKPLVGRVAGDLEAVSRLRAEA